VSATIACLLAWIYIGDSWSTEYVDDPETKPGGVWKLQGVTVLEAIISIVMM